MKYSAIDLHSNNSVVVVLDESDRVLVQKRVPNALPRIIELLEPHRAELTTVVVESTYNWYWLVDGLKAAGFTVQLANTHAVKVYDGLKHSGDEDDARHLAHLARLGILPTGYITPPLQRALRDLARRRLHLVRARTTQILSAENQYVRQTGQHLNSNDIKRLTDETVRKMGLPSDVECGLCATVCVIQALSAQIEVLEARLLEANVGTKEWALINSVPGIGKVLGTVILLEVGSIGRFACAGRFASYARCVDSARMSNGKKKGEGNSKNGNQHLSWAFVEAAHFAARFYPQAKRFYDRKKARTNGAVATKALAHKLARAVFHVLRDGVPFDVKRCFGG